MNAKTLREAQAAVMQDVGYIMRDPTAKQQIGYPVLTERAVIAALRPSMLAHGIVFYPIKTTFDHHGEYPTARGGRMGYVRILRTFRFLHVPSGEHADVEVAGEGAHGGDAASAKAMTIAKKYALREFFGLETGDDETEVVEQRGLENADLFQRAAAALSSMTTAEEVDERMVKILASKVCQWTDEQREALNSIAGRKKMDLMARPPSRPASNSGI